MREFSLTEFAAFLTETTVEAEMATHHALERAGRIVQREAKAEIGHYQDAAPPFAAWAELAQSTKDDRVRQGYTENDPGLRSGEMRESVQYRVLGHEVHIGSDDQKLVYFELGTEKQPPRTVLAGSLIKKTTEVVSVIGHEVTAALFGEGVALGSMQVGNFLGNEDID